MKSILDPHSSYIFIIVLVEKWSTPGRIRYSPSGSTIVWEYIGGVG